MYIFPVPCDSHHEWRRPLVQLTYWQQPLCRTGGFAIKGASAHFQLSTYCRAEACPSIANGQKNGRYNLSLFHPFLNHAECSGDLLRLSRRINTLPLFPTALGGPSAAQGRFKPPICIPFTSNTACCLTCNKIPQRNDPDLHNTIFFTGGDDVTW